MAVAQAWLSLLDGLNLGLDCREVERLPRHPLEDVHDVITCRLKVSSGVIGSRDKGLGQFEGSKDHLDKSHCQLVWLVGFTPSGM